MEKVTFEELNISEEVKRAVREIGFTEATEIQSAAIPLILEGVDVIGHSQTGSGKTAAFGIPAIELIEPGNRRDPQVLVLCPTRELAMQSCDEIRRFLKYKEGIKVLAVYGGEPIGHQISALKRGAQIIIGTPGRVMDHLRRKTIKTQNLKMVVLDEADEMLNMGFREDIETILEDVPQERQTVLFSATMPPAILAITKQYQNNPKLIKIARKQMTVSTIEQFYYDVPKDAKIEALTRLLSANDIRLSMVFCNTKSMVDDLAAELKQRGYRAEGLHGDMKQTSRTKVLDLFKNGQIDILVATDVAARGIDVDNIDAVFNFDLPQDTEYYVHRIGRTGRAGKSGRAYTLITGRKQFYSMRDLMRMTKANIIKKELPTYEEMERYNLQKFTERIAEKANRDIRPDYYEVYQKLLDEVGDSAKLGAAMVRMLMKKDKKLAVKKVVSLDQKKPRTEKNRPSQTRRGKMGEIVISIGRKQQIGPNHIVGAITQAAGIPGNRIGHITILDNSTIVEVPKEYREEIVRSLDGCKIKGTLTKTVISDAKRFSSGKNSFGSVRRDGKKRPQRRG